MSYEQDLSQSVNEAGDLMVVSMRELRDGFDFKRLGPNVVTTISRQLDRVGLRHAPEELPDDQSKTVLLFRRGTTTESIADAVLRPSEAGAQSLREFIQSDASDVLERVKALVCE